MFLIVFEEFQFEMGSANIMRIQGIYMESMEILENFEEMEILKNLEQIEIPVETLCYV